MGGFKALKKLSGIPLILHVVRKLKPFFGELLIVTNHPSYLNLIKRDLKEIRIIKDEYLSSQTYKSSLVGIYTGLKNSSFSQSFIVACDMPFLNLDLINYLAGKMENFNAVLPKINGFIEPLHAIYAQECLVNFHEAALMAEFKICNVIKALTVNYIKEKEIATFDPHCLSIFNINQPEDLEKAEKIL
ncbi:MAG: putative molybdenum cofactor guanylyltransferase [candidate division WS2 bacterium]|nr:putative molybdenum cofactor guanylyltransferase [Candidatus Psychracetigena formicireducens]